MPNNTRYRHQPGFTMTEVVVSLIILATLATLLIPQIIVTSQRQQAIAKMRATVASLEGAYYSARTQQAINEEVTLYANLRYRLNPPAAELDSPAPAHPLATTHACRAGAGDSTHQAKPSGLASTDVGGWFQLKNNVTVTGLIGRTANDTMLEQANVRRLVLCIDINSDSSPNKMGDDIFFGNFYYTTTGRSFFWGSSTGSSLFANDGATALGNTGNSDGASALNTNNM